MRQSKVILLLAIFLVTVAAGWAMASGGLADQKGVLAGKVSADRLALPGASVREGDVLVLVETITGPVPAVRATLDGKVREVLVRPGDVVHPGDVLVRIEPSRK